MSSATQTRHDQHGRYPEACSVEDFQRNLAAVRTRIEAACRRVGRDPASVRLLPVSKTKPEPSLRLAYAAGCRMLGGKQAPGGLPQMGRHAGPDRPALVPSSATCRPTRPGWWRVSPPSSRRWTACVSPKRWIAACRSKGGGSTCSCRSTPLARRANTAWLPPMFRPFSRRCPAFSALRVRGLMTLALFSSEAERVRQCFVQLRGPARPAAPMRACRDGAG